MELLTSRLRLRPWTEDDVEALHRLWSNAQTIWWGANTSLAQTAETLKTILAQEGWWAVELQAELIGNVFLRPSRRQPGFLELGYHFLPSSWGQGFATESARRVLEYVPQNDVEATVVPDNLRSQAVVRKLGFEVVGQVMHAGRLHDHWLLRRQQTQAALADLERT